MKRSTISAAQFKAKCLGLLDSVQRTRRGLVITKRGKPIAQLVPLDDPRPLSGSITSERDIVSPTGERWQAP